MSTSLKEYQVDHLFLLIGKNPLPNYVAAKTLLREGGIPYLVHTTDTLTSAQRLWEMLRDDVPELESDPLISLDDQESDAHYIKTKIERQVGQIEKNAQVGLNYTGGTKAMSVHAYRTLFKARPDAIFSYLDPRKLEMCIDREDRERVHRKITLEVSIEEVSKLHVPALKKPPITEPHLPDIAKVLAVSSAEWSTWISNVLLPVAKKKKPDGTWGNWEGTQKLKSILLPLQDLPEQIIDMFQIKQFITSDGCFSLKDFQEKGGFIKSKKPLEDACNWLRGIWLEHYVLDQIKENAKKYLIYDYGMSLKVPIKPDSSDDFEFDVAFMRNYQLFALSCTTDNKKDLCKQKLFEAYLRAAQLGGDEARVALVCCYDEPSTLKAELEVAIKDRKIEVFGREDLAELADKIGDWIYAQEAQ